MTITHSIFQRDRMFTPSSLISCHCCCVRVRSRRQAAGPLRMSELGDACVTRSRRVRGTGCDSKFARKPGDL